MVRRSTFWRLAARRACCCSLYRSTRSILAAVNQKTKNSDTDIHEVDTTAKAYTALDTPVPLEQTRRTTYSFISTWTALPHQTGTMSPNGRLLLIVLATVAGMTLWLTYNHVFPDEYDLDPASAKTRDSDIQSSSLVGPAMSCDKTTPPGTGCEEVVSSLQRLLIEGYTPLFEGIRHVNVWGYLGEFGICLLVADAGEARADVVETPNKGDAAIWVAQQMFLSTMGIETMEACR